MIDKFKEKVYYPIKFTFIYNNEKAKNEFYKIYGESINYIKSEDYFKI